MSSVASLRTVRILALAFALVACGASKEGAPAREPASTEPEPATLDEAKAQLERARAELGGGASSKRPATAGATADSTKAEEARDADGAPGREAAACVTACRAIRSMRRAVIAICRMAGDTDVQCIDARSTLVTSEKRVEACGC